jgi:hypothetical protein
MVMILDVGSGTNPYAKADVFCDLNRTYTPQTQDWRKIRRIKVISLFVCCDAQYLPFIENCFSLVHASHVIEHVQKPKLMLKELVRVSKEKVFIRCPYKYGQLDFNFHIQHLDEEWFRNLLPNNLIFTTKALSIERSLAILLYKLKLRPDICFNPIELLLLKFRMPIEMIFILMKLLHIIDIGKPREIYVLISKNKIKSVTSIVNHSSIKFDDL